MHSLMLDGKASDTKCKPSVGWEFRLSFTLVLTQS